MQDVIQAHCGEPVSFLVVATMSGQQRGWWEPPHGEATRIGSYVDLTLKISQEDTAMTK